MTIMRYIPYIIAIFAYVWGGRELFALLKGWNDEEVL